MTTTPVTISGTDRTRAMTACAHAALMQASAMPDMVWHDQAY